MVATFCFRLALGMLGALLLLSPKQMHPRFFRTHFLTILGLCLVATLMAGAGSFKWAALTATVLALLGAVIWVFERAAAGWIVLGITVVAIVTALALQGPSVTEESANTRPLPMAARLADDLTAALLLGFAMTAMLVGHSYLISLGLTIQPLMRQLAALGVAIVMRVGVAATALWCWTAEHDLSNLNNETVLWLPVRWLVGLLGPLGFGWMAYRTAKIRSTQSATGILYVVVILAFLGELTSLLLLRETGLPL